jgi:hypothetical protein
MPQLPPPDPYEALGQEPPDGIRRPAPTVVFLAGPPTADADRLTDAILAARPGALVVVARS